MAKFLVLPGVVYSQTDGQRHWVGAFELIHLYGVDRADCVIRQMGLHEPPLNLDSYRGMIVLEPRYDGDYTLPEEPL